VVCGAGRLRLAAVRGRCRPAGGCGFWSEGAGFVAAGGSEGVEEHAGEGAGPVGLQVVIGGRDEVQVAGGGLVHQVPVPHLARHPRR